MSSASNAKLASFGKRRRQHPRSLQLFQIIQDMLSMFEVYTLQVQVEKRKGRRPREDLYTRISG
jgi:hypothetical protein